MKQIDRIEYKIRIIEKRVEYLKDILEVIFRRSALDRRQLENNNMMRDAVQRLNKIESQKENWKNLILGIFIGLSTNILIFYLLTENSNWGLSPYFWVSIIFLIVMIIFYGEKYRKENKDKEFWTKEFKKTTEENDKILHDFVSEGKRMVEILRKKPVEIKSLEEEFKKKLTNTKKSK